ncbi:hypothetical protein [Paraburkholderia sp. BL10I2N1]|uniref:hypothetical protein n=1 Tax=Paraburkholderia sp. BL10I2N1 TaxID=1938796 RepID=UPI00105B99E2|nr:hypothetical protein [Paraburkholderia sp. BL10I2N1]TDN69080.1 hypothetical protein B0G77_2449 [Paraburkholderia sp. BL10I2N1]
MGMFGNNKSRAAESKAQVKAEKTDKKPAATFWDDPEPSKGAKPQAWKTEHAGIGNIDPTISFDESLELQTQIEGTSREYGQQAINARQEDRQPVSRERIEAAMMRPRASRQRDGMFDLSTHRAARGELQMSTEEFAATKEKQESRAWASLTRMLELFAR